MNTVKGTDLGLSGDDQIKICLNKIIELGGTADMKDLYESVENKLNGNKLSEQGKSSLRFLINKVAVQASLIYPHDKNNPGWKITPQGKEYIKEGYDEKENVIDTETQKEEEILSNTSRGLAFEQYVSDLLKIMYPQFVWFHQGLHKKNERGLDFIGNILGLNDKDKIKTIGVQVKFHQEKHIPTDNEWLKFLAGCFTNRVDFAIFITTGSMSGEQMRQARESNVLVIQGIDEISRVCKQYNMYDFKLFKEIETDKDA